MTEELAIAGITIASINLKLSDTRVSVGSAFLGHLDSLLQVLGSLCKR